MTTRMKLLLVLTIVGFVVPNVMLAVFFVEHPGDIGLYFESWFETLPAAQLVADLVIAFVAFTVWAACSARLGRRRGEQPARCGRQELVGVLPASPSPVGVTAGRDPLTCNACAVSEAQLPRQLAD